MDIIINILLVLAVIIAFCVALIAVCAATIVIKISVSSIINNIKHDYQ